MATTITRIVGCAIAAVFTGTVLAGGDMCVIRVGDRDGFGIGDGAGLLNFAGNPVNVDGAGVLGVGDFLPDWNGDGHVATNSGDDFDLRAADELSDVLVGAWALINVASYGARFTDVAISHSYDATFGVPNDFPDPPSTDRNDAFFMFEFEADPEGIDTCGPLFFKIVFADVGGGETSELVLTLPSQIFFVDVHPLDPPVEDGVIRSCLVELPFDAVFTYVEGVYRGHVQVELVTCPSAPDGDAYYAVDYVQIWNPAASCTGDTTGDGVVDVDDLLLLLGVWGEDCTDPCAPGCGSDLDDDEDVDVDDLLALLAVWGTCPVK